MTIAHVLEKDSGRVGETSFTGATTSGTLQPALFLSRPASESGLASGFQEARARSESGNRVGLRCLSQGTGCAERARGKRGPKGLTPGTILLVRERRARGERCGPIAKDLGLSSSTVSQIGRGDIWKDVGGPLTRNGRNESLDARFELRVDRSGGPDACHPWTACTDSDGYGQLKKAIWGESKASRWALRRKLGREIGPGLQAIHSCDNPPCCNERHLSEGTNLDNVRDRDAKGRGHSLVGDGNPKSILRSEQVIALRAEFASVPRGERSRWIRESAKAAGLKWWSLENVVYGKTWRHLLPGTVATPTPKGAAQP
jgi:hypothetical protein